MFNSIKKFAISHAMVLIAWCLAAVSMFFVPPDGEYVSYFNVNTLACLFLTLLVVGAFSNVQTFEIAARKIVLKLKNVRRLFFAVVFITYIGSMVLANDMALITFLPLGYLTLKKSGKQKYTAYMFVLQNIAANLGGMITPFGNPQNMYLYSHFNISNGEFLLTMLPPVVISLVLIIICCAFVKPEELTLTDGETFKFHPVRTAVYSVLFVISVLAVMRVVPWYAALLTVGIAIAALDIKAYGKVSYSLLLTFCAFFILSGNLSRISAVKNLLEGFTAKSTLITGVLCCQFISNVPTAVLLSHFVTDYAALLVAVNIGGTGTLIASLASLITFGKYKEIQPDKTLKYLGLFSAVNFAFLGVLTFAEWLIFTML